MPIKYFPLLDHAYAMTMGTAATNHAGVVEVEQSHYRSELAIKEQILARDHRYHVQQLPGSELARWEALDLVLSELSRQYPAWFSYACNGVQRVWHNVLLGERRSFVWGDCATLPFDPLDYAGRQVQEDLLLLADAPGVPLVAGQLCFGNAWCLDDKLGLSFLAIHSPVPIFDAAIGRSAQLLMERIKPNRPVWRTNWSVVATDQLDYAPRWRDTVHARKLQVTPENAGERVFFRVERQGLARLPQSRAVLFTIHTYCHPLAALNTSEARALAITLATAPHETLEYKGILPFIDALQSYLAACDDVHAYVVGGADA